MIVRIDLNELKKKVIAAYAQAQFKLGKAYYDGHGVTQNFNKAMEWWLKAADLGDIDAQKEIASLCNAGHGVTRVYKEAHKWHVKVAGQRNFQGLLNNYKGDIIFKRLNDIVLHGDPRIYEIDTDKGLFYILDNHYFATFWLLQEDIDFILGEKHEFIEAISPIEIRLNKHPDHYLATARDFEHYKNYLYESDDPDFSICLLIKATRPHDLS